MQKGFEGVKNDILSKQTKFSGNIVEIENGFKKDINDFKVKLEEMIRSNENIGEERLTELNSRVSGIEELVDNSISTAESKIGAKESEIIELRESLGRST